MIGIDIKQGQFVIYPSGEILPFIEGTLTKCYYKNVGNSIQLKVAFKKDNKEYTLNCITGNVTYQSLVTTLIENGDSEFNISLEKRNNGIRDYYLIKKNEVPLSL